MEFEKVIGLISALFTAAVFLLILNATLPRFAGFSSHIASRSFPAFTLQYWLLLAVIIAAAVLAFMWIRREE